MKMHVHTSAAMALLAALALTGANVAGSQAQTAAPTATAIRPSPTPDRDWDLPSGHYYTEAGAGQGGYTIADDSSMPFWTTFQKLGGVSAIGYPASRRYSFNGLVYQATQAALLQWRPDLNAVVLGNTFEQLQDAGKDDWLLNAKGIPHPITDDGSASYDDAVRIRLGWLTEPAIAARYFANPNPAVFKTWTQNDSIQLYGLPMSQPQPMGPFIAQRFQRIAFQRWTDTIPGMPAPGTVVPVLGGDLMKEAGIIAGAAATPHQSADVVSKAVALGATPFPTVAAFSPSSTHTAGTAASVTPTPRPAATASPRPSGSVQVIDGTLSEYSISLPQIQAKPGTVRFAMSNVGALRHNLRVVGSGLDRKLGDLRPGQKGSLDVTFTDPGTYTVYCDLADHADRGMTLTFTIQG
jgi:plastocyanin